MKKISKKLYDACEFASANENNESISKHLKNYRSYNIYYNNEYYYLTEEEKQPAYDYFNSRKSLQEIKREYGVKEDTVKRRMAVLGLEFETHHLIDFNRSKFSEKITPEHAYWIGFILADGYINEDRGFLKVKLGGKDREHLKKLASFFDAKESMIKSECGGAYTKDNLCYSITFNSRELINDLILFNLFQRKSGREIPYEFNDFELKKAYIRGIIDGDGHVGRNRFSLVGSREVCEYTKNFFKKWYNFREECSYIHQKGTIYSLSVFNKGIKKALQDIYLDSKIYLDRKYEMVKSYDLE